MKIQTKIPKLQMLEILHKSVNENIFMSFYVEHLKQQIWYSFTVANLLITKILFFNKFKMVVQFF